MDVTITLTVNGEKKTLTTDPDRPLLDVLREDLKLTGTKYGCGEGECRACTVLMDGEPVSSCVTTAAMADKKSITTIEGLAKGGAPHPVQAAFIAEGKVQCGYCMPGMVLRAAALLDKTPHPSDDQILEAMDGSVCRCGSYPSIMKAIRRAAGAEGSKA